MTIDSPTRTLVDGKPTGSSRSLTLLACCCAVVAFIVTFVGTHRGPGLSPDSLGYLEVARNLASGSGLRTASGAEWVAQGPGYPVALAAVSVMGSSVELAARLVNASAFAAAVLLGHILLRRHVASPAIVATGMVFVVVGPVMFAMAAMAWTETLFIVSVLAFVVALESAVSEQHHHRWWMAAAVTAVWVAFLVRFVGVALIIAGITAILITSRRQGWAPAIKRALAFGAASLIVPVTWAIRNTLVGRATPTESEAVSAAALVDIGKRMVAAVGIWVSPSITPSGLLGPIGLVVAVSLVCVWAWRWRRFEPTAGEHGATTLIPLASTLACYLGVIAVTQVFWVFDDVGNRLMSPVFIPAVVLVAVMTERIVASFSPGRRSSLALLVVAIALLLGHAVSTGRDVAVAGREGLGYASAEWQSAPIHDVLAAFPRTAIVYSDSASGLGLMNSDMTFLPLPLRSLGTNGVLEVPDEFIANLACGDSYLVLDPDGVQSYVLSPDELASIAELTPLTEVDGWTISSLALGAGYQVSEPPDCPDSVES